MRSTPAHGKEDPGQEPGLVVGCILAKKSYGAGEDSRLWASCTQ